MFVGAPEVANVKLFVRLIVRLCPVGTVITTGDQTLAEVEPFNARQFAGAVPSQL
jgi:hypothetical protein